MAKISQGLRNKITGGESSEKLRPQAVHAQLAQTYKEEIENMAKTLVASADIAFHFHVFAGAAISVGLIAHLATRLRISRLRACPN